MTIGLSIVVLKCFTNHIVLVIDRKQSHDILTGGKADSESLLSHMTLHFDQRLFFTAGLPVKFSDQKEFTRRRGHGLVLVQILHVLLQQFLHSRVVLLCDSFLIVVLVALERLIGIHGNQPHLIYAAQKIRQLYDPAANTFL